jgi:hypothetical protein
MIQRSQNHANPTSFNPMPTPLNPAKELFAFIFNNLALFETTDHTV